MARVLVAMARNPPQTPQGASRVRRRSRPSRAPGHGGRVPFGYGPMALSSLTRVTGPMVAEAMQRVLGVVAVRTSQRLERARRPHHHGCTWSDRTPTYAAKPLHQRRLSTVQFSQTAPARRLPAHAGESSVGLRLRRRHLAAISDVLDDGRGRPAPISPAVGAGEAAVSVSGLIACSGCGTTMIPPRPWCPGAYSSRAAAVTGRFVRPKSHRSWRKRCWRCLTDHP